MKTKNPKKAYTPEYKEQAVLHAQGVGIGPAARELGISAQTLCSWVKARDAGKHANTSGHEVTPEQMELSRLRSENVRLQLHVEILKKATAYFARDVL